MRFFKLKDKYGDLSDFAFCTVSTAVVCVVVWLFIQHMRPLPGSFVWIIKSPVSSSGIPAATVAPLSGSISVNSAGMEELMSLPGVGPALAENIIEERQRNGRFHYPEDLLSVRGIGEKTLEKLLPYLNLD